MSVSIDQLDELCAVFGFAPGWPTELDLDAAIDCSVAFYGVASAEEVHAGRITEFEAIADFADLVVTAEMITTPERQGLCADTFRTAYEIALLDARNGHGFP